MPYTNDTKPSSTFSNDSEAGLANRYAGSPLGLLLTLTWTIIDGENYVLDVLTTSTYTNDSK